MSAPTGPGALAEATAIARSAACEEIDWNREPLTERERKIRWRVLENMTAFQVMALHLRRMPLRRNDPPVASDLERASELIDKAQDA
jgi:hypothetical protein